MKQTILRRGANWFGMTALTTMMTVSSMYVGAQSSYRLSTLQTGTVLPVKLDNSLSSNIANRGDHFTATLRADYGQDYDGLPFGTKVEGVVRDVHAQRDKDPGVLDLEFRRIDLPDGHTYPIHGSLIGLDNKSVSRASDGRLIAKPAHKNDRLTYAGIGAAGGLLIGALTKHTLEDVVIGGGLGYLFGTTVKSNDQVRDVTLKPGTELGVRLDQQVSFSDYTNAPSDNSTSRNSDPQRFHRTDNGIIDRTSVNSSNGYVGNATDIGVLVGDRDIRFDSTARPIVSHGFVLVPAKPVLSAAQASFNYNAVRQTMTATGAGGTVLVTAGSRVAIVNGSHRVLMEAPARKLNGTLYVPVRFFGLVTGSDASYDANSRTVILMSGSTGNGAQ